MRRCIIKQYSKRKTILAEELGKGIDMENAKNIVRQFQKDKYISAVIRENTLDVHTTVPHIQKICSTEKETVVTDYELEEHIS